MLQNISNCLKKGGWTVTYGMSDSYRKLVFIVIVGLVLISCTPILGSSVRFLLIGLAFGLIYMMRLPKGRKVTVTAPVLLIFGYILLNIFYRECGFSDSNWGNTLNEIIFLICFPIAIIAINNLKREQLKILFFVIVGIALVNIIENTIISILFPQINEYSTEYLDETFLKSINAGGSNFYNMSFFFTLICFFVFQNAQEKKTRKLMFSSFIIGCIYIIGFSNKGSVVVFLILSIVLLYIAKKEKRPLKLILVLIGCAGIVYLFCLIFQNELVNCVSEIIPSDRLRVRLITIIDPDNALANIDTISGRQNLYLLSVETWLSSFSNFLFGIGDIRAAYNPETTGIGQHADLLDTLARYGIIGGGLLLGILFRQFKMIEKRLFFGYRSQIQIIFILFLIYGCTKTILVPEVGSMIFLLFPLSYIILPQEKTNKNEIHISNIHNAICRG